VKLPVRPNGTEAWIRAGDVTLSTHRFRAQIDVADRSVTVWEGEEVVAETGAVVGADRTPTPLGSFYINEVVPKWADSVYGPFILSLSGFSEVLDTFGGGVPVIALHGTNHPELIGGAHSNGCIRIPNEVITQLAETLPVGTPVEIVA
jgi:lipoprotein-anchoring transpeptidase ErfK/SrfK